MGRGAPHLSLTAGIADGLSEFALEELQYIVDGVRQRYAGAPPDTVVQQLRAFQRVRQLDPEVVRRLAQLISDDPHRPG